MSECIICWRGLSTDALALIVALLVIMVALLWAERKTNLKKTFRYSAIAAYAVAQAIAVLAYHAQYGALLAVQTSGLMWLALLVGIKKGIRGSCFVCIYAHLACMATIVLAIDNAMFFG